MTFIKTALVLLALLANSNAANFLRAKQPRQLQLTSAVLNALIDSFGPALENVAQTVLAENFDPIYLGSETPVELGPFDIPTPTGPCPTSVSAIYGLGTITGLSGIDINSLELVPGSETIDLPVFGLGGAKWKGTWILNATFANLQAETTANLKAAASCLGNGVEQSLTGTTTLQAPSMEVSLTMGGTTSNLLNFAGSTQITSAQMDALDFELGSVNAGFGGTGTLFPIFDLSETFDGFLLNQFSDILEPLLLDALNSALANQLPMGL